MRERAVISIIVLVFLIIGGISAYLAITVHDFTFRRATISIDSSHNPSDLSALRITETLQYIPAQSYHTLYRNFETPIIAPIMHAPIPTPSIRIHEVSCERGTAYYRDNLGVSYLYTETLAYTESNEYGCSFGESYGFTQGIPATISGTYDLNPHIVYFINGNYYVRFSAYASMTHPRLVRGETLIVDDSIITKHSYYARDEVVMYIPVTLDTYHANYSPLIITRDDFEFTDSTFEIILIALLSFIPAIGIFLLWYFFGKEYVEEDIPFALSQYPHERKAWEVISYFHPPFGMFNDHFMATILLDFYARKIIDIKEKANQTYIKLVKKPHATFDTIESHCYALLEQLCATAPPDARDGGYVNITKILSSPNTITSIHKSYVALQKMVHEKSKTYIDYTGNYVFYAAFIGFIAIAQLLLAGLHAAGGFMLGAQIVLFIIAAVVAGKSVLFIRYHKEYYAEYQRWQAFKNYLRTMESMKTAPPQAVVLWDKYLVYATALGVEKTVITKFREWNILTPKQERAITTTLHAATPIVSTTRNSAGTRSGGGISGGGIGGGGGGGR